MAVFFGLSVLNVITPKPEYIDSERRPAAQKPEFTKESFLDGSFTKDFETIVNDPEVSVVAVSALLTTTMPAMEDIVTALNAHPRRAEFKIMVGGAPIDQAFADQIGADVYTEDAAAAGQAAKALALA